MKVRFAIVALTAALLAPACGVRAESDGGLLGLTRLLEDPRHCAEAAALPPDRPVTLETVIGQVVCNYPSVQRTPGLAGQAQAVLDRSLATNQPSLTFSAGVDAQTGYSSGAEAVLDVDWILFDFGTRDATRREARLALAATLSEQRNEVLNAVAEGAQLYGLALAAAGRVAAATRNLQTAQDSLRVAGARATGGAATAAEKLLAQTALAQARLDLNRASNEALTARGTLAVAMGQRASAEIVLPPPSESISICWPRKHAPSIRPSSRPASGSPSCRRGPDRSRWRRVARSA